MMKKKITIYLGFIISAILIIIFVKVIDFRTVLHILASFNWRLIIVLLIIYWLGMIFRTMRWFFLISQSKSINFSSVLSALILGFMINNLLPAKLGELARAEILARGKKLSRSFLLGTILAERLLDVMIVVIFLTISILFSKSLFHVISLNYRLAAIIAIIFVSLFLLLNKKIRKKIIKMLPKKWQRFFSLASDKFATSFLFLKDRELFPKILFYTVLVWLITFLSYYTIIRGLNVNLPLYAYLFVISVSAIGMVIPSSPANMGVYHAIATGAIMLFMVPKDTAFAIAVIANAFDVIPSIIFGTIILLKKHISLITLYRKEARQVSDLQ